MEMKEMWKGERNSGRLEEEFERRENDESEVPYKVVVK